MKNLIIFSLFFTLAASTKCLASQEKAAYNTVIKATRIQLGFDSELEKAKKILLKKVVPNKDVRVLTSKVYTTYKFVECKCVKFKFNFN